jgi:hypothetical protein
MKWEKVQQQLKSGQFVEALAPVIISASRSTDIPAFYAEWLVERLNEGYVKWKNPFNGESVNVSFSKARAMVFWSKNPRPLLKHLSYIDSKIKNYYFQFTLNDYDEEKLEPNVPNVQSRIDTFVELSEKVGKNKVIWRFDPLILTDRIRVPELLKKVEHVGNQLKNHTEKMVFSFADIGLYKKVQNNLRRSSIQYQEFEEQTMIEFAEGLQQLNQSWNFALATCAEKIALEKYGILHNKCIDEDLLIKLFPNDTLLMDFLGVRFTLGDLFSFGVQIEKLRDNKDKGQREYCGCIASKDIGEYDTCPHLCEYCYANTSKDIALANWNFHKRNPANDTIKGE